MPNIPDPEAWAHYNAAGTLIASGELWPDGTVAERCHLPFTLPDAPANLLDHPDHQLRVTAERVVEIMLRCLELKHSC